MNIRPAQLAAQYESARVRWPQLHRYERDYGLPSFLLFAVGSRETNLRAAFTEGTTGDQGHGHGGFQLDDRWHEIPEGFDYDIDAQATKAANMLAGLFEREDDWQRALNRYNSGSPDVNRTTGRDYGPDVWSRREYLAANYKEDSNAAQGTDGDASGHDTPGAGDGGGFGGSSGVNAQAVIAFFERNEGLGEDRGVNRNWITDWYGMTGPWCAMTVSRAFYEAGGDSIDWITGEGISTTTARGWAYVPYMRTDFENAGRWTQDPQPGDVTIFDWDGDGWGDHVGIFLRGLDDGETCLVWEGNTSDNDLSLRRRPYTLIAGYGRPPYQQSQEEDDMADPKVIEALGQIHDRLTFMHQTEQVNERTLAAVLDKLADVEKALKPKQPSKKAGA